MSLTSPATPKPAPRTATAERILAELLAEVLGTDRVTVDGHFFDDLGADSLGMARFCARVRGRDDLPAVSIKDVYRHPTIAELAAAMTRGAESTPPEAGALQPPPAVAAATHHLLCGALQLLAVLGYVYLAALLFIWGSEWVSAGSGAAAAPAPPLAVRGAGFFAPSPL